MFFNERLKILKIIYNYLLLLYKSLKFKIFETFTIKLLLKLKKNKNKIR